MIRSLDQLRRDQEAILAAHRAESESPSAETRPASPAAMTGSAYARVTEVIATNENLGPHLLVMRQAWTGTPPAPSDAGLAAQLAYPLPGHSVTEFQVNQLVHLDFVPGAALAMSVC